MSTYRDGVLVPAVTRDLLAMPDGDFERRAEASIERLRAATDAAEARSIYGTVLPCEYERVRRDAVRRARGGEPKLGVLIATVGAQSDSPALAVLASPARHVILLHTQACRAQAVEVVQKLSLDASEATLVDIGDGKDPLRLYRAIFEHWAATGRPELTAVDLTGGLKTMSAATAVAGFAIPKARVFYIDAEQWKGTGETFWIRERRIELNNPFEVFGEIRRNTARSLLREHRYAAAAVAYDELAKTVEHGRPDELRGRLARAYDALDGLDFETARATLSGLCGDLERFATTMQNDEVVQKRGEIAANAEGAERLCRVVPTGRDADPIRVAGILCSDECLDLGQYLLTAARRREAEGSLDAAALLGYRVLELVPQRRLAERGGVDPSRLVWATLAAKVGVSIDQLVATYNGQMRNKEHRIDANDLPKQVARVQCFALLRTAFPDDVGASVPLERFAGVGESRNRSVLAHGVQKLEAGTVKSLLDLAQSLFDEMLKLEKLSAEDVKRLRKRHEFVDVPQ